MSTKSIAVLMCGIGVLICCIVFAIVPFIAEADVTYRGQEIFLSQEDYEQFKQGIKTRVYQDSLELESFDVLASDPPIIVNFKVTVPFNYHFPYGSARGQRPAQIFAAVAISILAGLTCIFLSLSVTTQSEG